MHSSTMEYRHAPDPAKLDDDDARIVCDSFFGAAVEGADRSVDLRTAGPPSLRDLFSQHCRTYTGGVEPREFQLDVAEAVYARRDVIVQAATGMGKTLAMVLPLFAFPNKFIIIASPLNILEQGMVRVVHLLVSISLCIVTDKNFRASQERALNDWNLKTFAYNAAVRTPELFKVSK